MNRTVLLAAMVLTAVTISPMHAAQATVIVALTDNARTAPELFLTEFNRAFLNLRLGSSFLVYNAPARNLLTRISIPDETRFANANIRVRHFGAQLEPARRFVTERFGADRALSSPPSQLGVPGILDEIGKNVVASLPNRRAEILLFGSALHIDPREQFSMIDGLVPDDGHLNASELATPYGTRNRQGLLRGVTVHFCHTEHNPAPGAAITPTAWETDLQRERVERLWSLYVAALGGTLATFSPDLSTCFARLNQGGMQPGRRFELDPTQDKLVMRRTDRTPSEINTTTVLPPAPRSAVGPTPPAAANFMGTGVTITRTPPAVTVGQARLGIRWAGDLDLDLWARRSSSPDWLSFSRLQTVDGRLHEDLQTAPGQDAYEMITFNGAVDLAAMEAWVNFYAGSAPGGTDVTVRLWFENQVFERVYRMPASSGDTAMSRFSGPAWVRINLLEVVGLPSRQSSNQR